jgi:sigma-B regulation protein RsbU (phosphoserine phosphatase)
VQDDRLLILSDSTTPQCEADVWVLQLNAGLAEAGLPLSNLSRLADETWPPQLDKHSRGIVVFPSESNSPENALAPSTRALMKQASRHDLPTVVISDHDDQHVSAGISGVTVLSSETSAGTICAVLLGMFSREETIHELRMQNEINGRIIENVTDEIDLIDEELQSAMLVQKALLPQEMPSSQDVSMAAFWRPSSYVSGDFYQARMLDETRMGILLADAAGHGVGSALMTMIMAKSFEPCSDDNRILSPGEVMQGMNDGLCQIERSRSRFATGIYVVLDCEDGSLSYSTAGHPPPMILGKNRITALDLENGGPGLGIFDDSEFETMHGRLEAGDSLLIYSDGFEQAFPTPDATEETLHLPNNAYLRVFKSLAGLGDPKAMIDRLEAAIDARRGSLRQKDDLTLLCIHHATGDGPDQMEVGEHQLTFPSSDGLS